MITHPSPKEELHFKGEEQYSRSKSPRDSILLKAKGKKKGPCFYCCHNPEVALGKYKSAEQTSKSTIWKFKGFYQVLKLVNKTTAPIKNNRKLTVCHQTMQTTWRNRQGSTPNTCELTKICVNRYGLTTSPWRRAYPSALFILLFAKYGGCGFVQSVWNVVSHRIYTFFKK